MTEDKPSNVGLGSVGIGLYTLRDIFSCVVMCCDDPAILTDDFGVKNGCLRIAPGCLAIVSLSMGLDCRIVCNTVLGTVDILASSAGDFCGLNEGKAC